MIDHTGKQPDRQGVVHRMKRDWDERARQNAKWFINTIKLDQSDEEFDETGRQEVEKLLLADLPLLAPGRDPQSMRILEIGCGLGRMTQHLARSFGEVCGTDVSGEMIRQARARFESSPNVRFLETNGVDFPALPSDYFDLAFSFYVFQHVPSAEIIRANIADAYRVLKPGGVLRFQTTSITTLAYAEIDKDTWTGATFPEAEIRHLARDLGAQLMSLYGADTQYCWTTLRKPLRMRSAASAQPRIEIYGRVDDLQIKQIPLRGDHACLTLKLSGLSPEEVDANNLTVEINGREVWPIYVGPGGGHHPALPPLPDGEARDQLVQVNLCIPSGEPSGPATFRVRLSSGETSPPITVELLEPQPIIPHIMFVRNNSDGGLDLYARGPKSSLVIYAAGLDEAADTGNVRVQVGTQILKPSFVGFVPANGVHQINAQLPADIAPGETSLQIYFGNLASPVKPLQIKWADE